MEFLVVDLGRSPIVNTCIPRVVHMALWHVLGPSTHPRCLQMWLAGGWRRFGFMPFNHDHTLCYVSHPRKLHINCIVQQGSMRWQCLKAGYTAYCNDKSWYAAIHVVLTTVSIPGVNSEAVEPQRMSFCPLQRPHCFTRRLEVGEMRKPL